MTMKERIAGQVRLALRAAVDGERKDEIVEELSANLYAKYEDLVNSGVDPEEAYGQAMDSLGDVSELVDLCGGSWAKAEFDDMVDTLTDLGRTAVSGARSVWNEVKDPLKDMGRTIWDAMKSLEIKVTEESRRQFDYAVPADDIAGLELRLKSGDVVIHTWDQESIQVIERANRDLNENNHASFLRREDGVLCIEQGSTAAGWTGFLFGLFQSDFEIFLPRRMWRSVDIRSTEGDVLLTDLLEAEVLRVETTNGDVAFAEGVQAGQIKVSTVNGDLDLGAGTSASGLDVTTMNGDTHGENLTLREVTVKTTNGAVSLAFGELPGTMELSTVSGDMTVTLPENGGFAVAYQQVSGELNAAFDMTTSVNRKSGVASYQGAQAPMYQLSTVSGDINLERA